MKQGGADTYRQGSSRKGGQSAPRFQRIRDQQVSVFKTSITDTVETAWYDAETNRSRVDGVVLCGNGPVFRTAKVGKHLAKYVVGRVASQKCEPFDLYAEFAPLIDTADAEQHERLLSSMLDSVSPLLVYGARYLQQALANAELKTLYVTPRRHNATLQKACDRVGCTVVVTTATQTLRTLGGSVGIKWYAEQRYAEQRHAKKHAEKTRSK